MMNLEPNEMELESIRRILELFEISSKHLGFYLNSDNFFFLHSNYFCDSYRIELGPNRRKIFQPLHEMKFSDAVNSFASCV